MGKPLDFVWNLCAVIDILFGRFDELLLILFISKIIGDSPEAVLKRRVKVDERLAAHGVGYAFLLRLAKEIAALEHIIDADDDFVLFDSMRERNRVAAAHFAHAGQENAHVAGNADELIASLDIAHVAAQRACVKHDTRRAALGKAVQQEESHDFALVRDVCVTVQLVVVKHFHIEHEMSMLGLNNRGRVNDDGARGDEVEVQQARPNKNHQRNAAASAAQERGAQGFLRAIGRIKKMLFAWFRGQLEKQYDSKNAQDSYKKIGD